MIFNSWKDEIGSLPAFCEERIKNEPMFFSVDREFAENHGRGLTLEFLKFVKEQWGNSDVVIDSRVHMLMPGWYPCIPGWHLDDVPRGYGPLRQPEHKDPHYKSEHIMAISGDASLTHFAVGQIELEEPKDRIVYGQWHWQIEKAILDGDIKEVEIPNNAVVRFDWTSFHRGMPARKNGWRWFIRASRNTRREIKNEIRQQVQVYLSEVNAGW